MPIATTDLLRAYLRMPWARGLLVLLITSALGWWYATTYLWVSPREEIERVLEQARRAAEGKHLLTLRELLAPDYRDASGMDAAEVIAALHRHFLGMTDVSVTYPLVLFEDEAMPANVRTATLIVVVQVSGRETTSGQRFVGIAGQGGDAFLVRMVRINGTWKVAYTEYLETDSPTRIMEQLRASHNL